MKGLVPELEGAETPPPEVGDQARTPGEVKGLAELEGAEAGNSGEDWSPVCRRTSSQLAGHADPPQVPTHETQQKGQPPSDGGARKAAGREHRYVLHSSDTSVVAPRITPPRLRLPPYHMEPKPSNPRSGSSATTAGPDATQAPGQPASCSDR